MTAAPAFALVMIDNGDGSAILRGRINAGDDKAFAAFLSQPRARAIRTIWLDSGGGSVAAGIAIGKAVRQARLTTAVDAQRAVCDSACTLVFAGGVRRHYVNSAIVFEGNSALNGLGFHPSSLRGDAQRSTTKSARGTNQMIAHYRAMGTSAAAQFMQRAAINTLFRPSGATALRARVATSLASP